MFSNVESKKIGLKNSNVHFLRNFSTRVSCSSDFNVLMNLRVAKEGENYGELF